MPNYWAETPTSGTEVPYGTGGGGQVSQVLWNVTVPARSRVLRVVCDFAIGARGHSFRPLYQIGWPIVWKFQVQRITTPAPHFHPINVQSGVLAMSGIADHTKSLLTPADGLYSGEELVWWSGGIDEVNTRRSDSSTLVDIGTVVYEALVEFVGRPYGGAVAAGDVPWIDLTWQGRLRVLYELA